MSVAEKVTLKDVARAAGVSMSTVSGVLNRLDGFSEDTRRRVWDAVGKMNYMPNLQARTLRSRQQTQQHRRTGLLMHITHLGSNGSVGDVFEALRSQLLTFEALRHGCYMTTYWYRRLEGFRCPLLLDRMVDGVILGMPHPEVAEILRGKTPVVLMDVGVSAAALKMPMVNMNLPEGYGRLFQHAARNGFRDYVLIDTKSDPEDFNNSALFCRGLHDAAREAGLSPHPEGVFLRRFTPENHEATVAEIAGLLIPRLRSNQFRLLIVPNIVVAESLRAHLENAGLLPNRNFVLYTVNCYMEDASTLDGIGYDWPKLVETAVDLLLKFEDMPKERTCEYLVSPRLKFS